MLPLFSRLLITLRFHFSLVFRFFSPLDTCLIVLPRHAVAAMLLLLLTIAVFRRRCSCQDFDVVMLMSPYAAARCLRGLLPDVLLICHAAITFFHMLFRCH